MLITLSRHTAIYLPISCRRLVDRRASLGSCKTQIYFNHIITTLTLYKELLFYLVLRDTALVRSRAEVKLSNGA